MRPSELDKEHNAMNVIDEYLSSGYLTGKDVELFDGAKVKILSAARAEAWCSAARAVGVMERKMALLEQASTSAKREYVAAVEAAYEQPVRADKAQTRSELEAAITLCLDDVELRELELAEYRAEYFAKLSELVGAYIAQHAGSKATADGWTNPVERATSAQIVQAFRVLYTLTDPTLVTSRLSGMDAEARVTEVMKALAEAQAKTSAA